MAPRKNFPELHWPLRPVDPSARRRRSREAPRCLPLMHVLVAGAGGVLLSHLLASESALGMACALIVLAAALPFLAARLLKRRLSIRGERPSNGSVLIDRSGEGVEPADEIPAGLLIVSSDLRICYANRTYLEATFQAPEEVLGWRLEDVVPAEGLEEQVKALLRRSYRATSCCFTSFPGAVPTERRAVSITMTRIPPVDGEDRLLLVVEDLLQDFPERQAPLVEGYIC